MAAQFDMEQENARFWQTLIKVQLTMAIFIFIYMAIVTYEILRDDADYFHDWRGPVCIALTVIVFILYLLPTLLNLRIHWPLSLPIAIGIWGGMYGAVIVLSLINDAFAWNFYIVFAISCALFRGRNTMLTVAIAGLTMFAFQGLLTWPPSYGSLFTIIGQSLTLVSITGFIILFQNLMGERFERNRLLKQLSQSNSELEETHRQLAQSMAQEQELAVLRERTRLAREMHDTIGHALVLISVKLEAAQRLRTRDPERCDHELEATKQVARETMTALRASIADLRSPALEHERINHALSRNAQEFAQRNNLHVKYTLQADLEPLPAAIEETLWKVSQEAFTNIEKHAHARNVQVHIKRESEQILLAISDDGVGLPATLSCDQEDGSQLYSSPSGHYGLRGIQERVAALGGHFTLQSEQGQGTTLEIELPLGASFGP